MCKRHIDLIVAVDSIWLLLPGLISLTAHACSHIANKYTRIAYLLSWLFCWSTTHTRKHIYTRDEMFFFFDLAYFALFVLYLRSIFNEPTIFIPHFNFIWTEQINRSKIWLRGLLRRKSDSKQRARVWVLSVWWRRRVFTVFARS